MVGHWGDHGRPLPTSKENTIVKLSKNIIVAASNERDYQLNSNQIKNQLPMPKALAFYHQVHTPAKYI